MTDYECQRCGKVLELPKKQTNETARKHHACETCNDMTTFERIDHDYTDMTDAQREFLRSIHEEIRVTKTSQTQKHIHLDGGESTLCNSNMDTRLVDVSKYPRGYLDWCEHCLERTKNPREDVSEGTDTTEEACKKAVRLADERIDGEITQAKFKSMDIYPSAWSIKKTLGSCSEAKEQSL